MSFIFNSRKILFFIFLGFVALPSEVFSQDEYKRKISISEWIEEMEAYEGELYFTEDTEIYFDGFKDSLYSFNQPKTKPLVKDIKAIKNIQATIILKNCKLPDNKTCQLRNLLFKQNITFIFCEGAAQLIFYNCSFEQGLDIQLCDFKMLEFRYCFLQQRVVINESDIGIFYMEKCSLYTDHRIVKGTHMFGGEKENQSYQYLFNIRLQDRSVNNFYLLDCEILPSDIAPIISFDGGKYDMIGFEGIDFSDCIVDFIGCSVKGNLTVLNCEFDQPIGVYKFTLPKDNSSFNWSQIDSVGLAYYANYNKIPFTHKTDTLISDVHIFNELNSSYRKFYSMYRTQGDIESANACYMQMKDMETMKYHYLYENDKSTDNWFNWRFNQFLKIFSEYGTNPVQSLIISMWVILVFAAVYFFFYSEWDGINRSFLIKQHQKVMQYFRSEQRLEDFYTENYLEDFKTFADYKKEMQEGKAELPVFITLLGKPLYLLSIVRHKILTFMYRRTELLQGRWVDLNPKRKVFVASIVSMSLIVYLFYLGLVRALNSTTLSINAFSTLGFGAIPVKGISRYITILEGFLGWFLLSIFSVSLISQMIQN